VLLLPRRPSLMMRLLGLVHSPFPCVASVLAPACQHALCGGCVRRKALALHSDLHLVLPSPLSAISVVSQGIFKVKGTPMPQNTHSNLECLAPQSTEAGPADLFPGALTARQPQKGVERVSMALTSCRTLAGWSWLCRYSCALRAWSRMLAEVIRVAHVGRCNQSSAHQR